MIVHIAVPRHTPARPDGCAPRLPLYLRGRVPTRVDVDGPAFLVQRQDKSPARYPFARVARIISATSVQWSARALTACMEQDIPIVFTGRGGVVCGYLHAIQRSPSRLDAALTELLDRPDALEHYALWLRAERMRTLQEWRQSREVAGRPVDEDEFRQLLRRHVYHADQALHGMAAESLYTSALSAYVLQQLQRSGARPQYWGPAAQPLRLANDLTALLSLRLALEMHGLGEAAHGDDAVMLTVLHNFGPKVQDHCHGLLARLHKHIREVLERWP